MAERTWRKRIKVSFGKWFTGVDTYRTVADRTVGAQEDEIIWKLGSGDSEV